MEAFLVSMGVIALSEIGDKTQLVALMLAARFRKPMPVILGIFTATLANHAFAGALGTWISALIDKDALRWLLGVSFLGTSIWALRPDKVSDEATAGSRLGIFGTTALAFFLAEMGDKTQIATLTLAARFDVFVPVVAGTTLGMMVADVPAVFLGDKFASKLPMRAIRLIAAALFAILGILALLDIGGRS